MSRVNSRNPVVLGVVALLTVAAVSSTGCVEQRTVTPDPEAQIQIIEAITAPEALALIENNRNNREFVIIDVRTPEEFAKGHIENAVNIDFYSAIFRDDLDKLDKDKTYLIYCRSGRRSGLAVPMMQELDFMEIYDMLGGIVSWVAEGFATTR